MNVMIDRVKPEHYLKRKVLGIRQVDRIKSHISQIDKKASKLKKKQENAKVLLQEAIVKDEGIEEEIK